MIRIALRALGVAASFHGRGVGPDAEGRRAELPPGAASRLTQLPDQVVDALSAEIL